MKSNVKMEWKEEKTFFIWNFQFTLAMIDVCIISIFSLGNNKIKYQIVLKRRQFLRFYSHKKVMNFNEKSFIKYDFTIFILSTKKIKWEKEV